MRFARRREGSRKGATRGFALLLVLIVLLALSLMFGALLQSSRQDTDAASDRVEQLKMAAALDGALISAAYELSLAHQEIQPGVPQPIRIGNYSVLVRVRPESSKLDLNQTSPENLQKLLESANVPRERATVLARRIIAWRNGPFGSATDDKSRTGSRPNRPFESIADLELVSGGGPDLAACLEPDVTVYTHATETNTAYSSLRLRHALTGDGSEPERSVADDSVVGGAAARPDLYEVTEEISDQDHPRSFRRVTVIRVTGDERRAVWIVNQKSFVASENDVARACKRLARHD